MPKQSYAFDPGGKKRLEIFWEKTGAGVNTVSLDGNLLDVVLDQKSLRSGHEMPLPDGSILKIQLVMNFSGNEKLRVSRDGYPVPGSDLDPQLILHRACEMLYAFAGLHVVVGLAGLFFDFEALRCYGVGTGSIIFGLIFLVLGFFTQRKSAIALILAVIVAVFYGIKTYFFAVSRGCDFNMGAYLPVFSFLVVVLPGVKAIIDINKRKRQ